MTDDVLAGLDSEAKRIIERYAFDTTAFALHRRTVLAARREGRPVEPARISGRVEALPARSPLVSQLDAAPDADHWRALGRGALERGEVGVIILAGGMATRFGGCAKACVEAVDGHTFLDLKLADALRCAREHATTIPVFIMTSFLSDAELSAQAERRSTEHVPVATFAQNVSLRLTPSGDLFRDASGCASPYAPGHGDLPEALGRSGLLERFMAGGGTTLVMSNVDNLAASIDPSVIGAHSAGGADITAEIVAKNRGDKGGAPALVDGMPQIVEEFRFPAGTDLERYPDFNTNTFVFRAEALRNPSQFNWFPVQRQVDALPALQFERLIGELTAFRSTRFLRVPRDGTASRFLPVKTLEDLHSAQPALRTLVRARGILAAR